MPIHNNSYFLHYKTESLIYSKLQKGTSKFLPVQKHHYANNSICPKSLKKIVP